IVYEDIDRAQLVPDTISHRLDLAPVGHVGLDRDGPPSFAAYPSRHILGLVGASDVVDSNVGALLGEYLGNTPADPAAGSRDQGDFVFQLHHASSRMVSLRPPRWSSAWRCYGLLPSRL